MPRPEAGVSVSLGDGCWSCTARRGSASTARWYAECLGFRTAGTVPAIQPYVDAGLIRDGVEAHAAPPRQRGPACAAGHAAPRTSGTQFFHLSRKHCASFLDPLIRLLGHRPRDIRPGHRLERQGGLRSCEAIRIHPTGTPTSSWSKSQAHGVPAGFLTQQVRHRGGGRVSQAAEVQGKRPAPCASAPSCRISETRCISTRRGSMRRCSTAWPTGGRWRWVMTWRRANSWHPRNTGPCPAGMNWLPFAARCVEILPGARRGRGCNDPYNKTCWR